MLSEGKTAAPQDRHVALPETVATPSAFKEMFKRWGKEMRDAQTGPLRIAEEVVAAADDWDPKEADGIGYSGMLERVFGDGKGLRFFAQRSQAVKALGGMREARIFEHGAAVWLTHKAQDEQLRRAVAVCAAHFHKNSRCPLTVAQVERATREALGRRPRTRVAVESEELLRLQRENEALRAENEELRALVDGSTRSKASRTE